MWVFSRSRAVPEHAIGKRVVEEQLAGVHHGAAHVHLHVDVEFLDLPASDGVVRERPPSRGTEAFNNLLLAVCHFLRDALGRVGLDEVQVQAQRERIRSLEPRGPLGIAHPDHRRGARNRATFKAFQCSIC